jgi:hypothetical protein
MKKGWLPLIFTVFLLQSCVVQEEGRYGGERVERGERREGGRYASCGGEYRLRVADLDMVPDPVAQGERLRAWRVRIGSEGRQDCQTTLSIRERTDGDVVGRARIYYLRPGMNTIDFDPLESYRFHRREHCFDVIADVAGSGRPVDAARTFCARQTAGNRWSLR